MSLISFNVLQILSALKLGETDRDALWRREGEVGLGGGPIYIGHMACIRRSSVSHSEIGYSEMTDFSVGLDMQPHANCNQ